MGVFGFLDVGEPQTDAPYNAALFDLFAALKLLRAEATAFGVDVDRITIMGNSAGASLTIMLLTSPLVPQSWISRAIITSGPIYFAPLINRRLSNVLVERTNVCSCYMQIFDIHALYAAYMFLCLRLEVF